MQSTVEMHTLVCIAPHPDDEVLSSGALLMKARDAGYELHLVWVSRGQKSTSAAASRRWDEASEVARRLDAKMTGLDLEDGHLDLGTVISVVEKVLKEIQPKHVVWPHGIGPAHHQDHRVVHEAVANILKRWDYARCAWLVGQPPVFDDQGFQPSLFVGYGRNEFDEICGLMGHYESEKRKDFAQNVNS